MKSKIYESDKIENLKRYKTANKMYYKAEFYDENDNTKPMLFTVSDIKKALDRGSKNPEDFEVATVGEEEVKGFWATLFG